MISLRIPQFLSVPGTMKIHEVRYCFVSSGSRQMQAKFLSHEDPFSIELRLANVKSKKLLTSEVFSEDSSGDECIFSKYPVFFQWVFVVRTFHIVSLQRGFYVACTFHIQNIFLSTYNNRSRRKRV